MLIVLNFPDGFLDHEKYAKELIKDSKGKFTITMPHSLEEWVSIVRNYRPKKTVHTILLASHYKMLKNASDGDWRATEMLLLARGGAVWGEPPARRAPSYAGTEENTEKILTEATYRAQRAMIFDTLSRKYLGRTDSDPHTAIVGLRLWVPLNSKISDYFLSGLPTDTGNEMPDQWWEGVSFLMLDTLSNLEKSLMWLSDTNIVTIGDRAHNTLTELNVAHGSMPEISKVFKVRDDARAKSVGRMVRETARTGDDNRQWRP